MIVAFVLFLTLQINYGDHNPAVHQPGFLRDKLGELLPAHFITDKRRQELERRVLTEHAQTNKDEAEVHAIKLVCSTPYNYHIVQN